MMWKPRSIEFRAQLLERVSTTSNWRLSRSADCDVPEVNVPPEEMGTEYCVPETTGENCVMGDANWNWSRAALTIELLKTAVSPTSAVYVRRWKMRSTLGNVLP